jgi:hypothetical protein
LIGGPAGVVLVARKTASMAASDSGIDTLITVEMTKDERAGPINAS